MLLSYIPQKVAKRHGFTWLIRDRNSLIVNEDQCKATKNLEYCVLPGSLTRIRFLHRLALIFISHNFINRTPHLRQSPH